ncbi:MAG: cupin domain-containing protein [Motiliproteus sp.]
MTAIPVLTQLGSMDTQTFLRDYWQKKPCVIRGVFNGAPPVISPDELAGLACEEEVESRLLITDPQSGQFELLHGPFPEEKFSQLPASHWSLLIQGVDLWSAEAANLVEQFRFIPNWRLDDLMISYSTREGGVGPHYDNYDVFIIQAQGRRRWEVGGQYLEHQTEFLSGQPVRILKHWQPEQSWELEPGDMIYIPPRVGHNGVAISDDCVNYSVGYRAQHASEMLQHFAGYCANHCPDELRFSDGQQTLRQHSGEIQSEDLQQVKKLLQQLLDDSDRLQRWWGEYVTESKTPEPGNIIEESGEDHVESIEQLLQHSDFIRRAEGVRFAFDRSDKGGCLYIAGQSFDLGPAEIALAELLCDQNQYRPEQISTWLSNPGTNSLLVGLFNAELLYPID